MRRIILGAARVVPAQNLTPMVSPVVARPCGMTDALAVEDAGPIIPVDSRVWSRGMGFYENITFERMVVSIPSPVDGDVEVSLVSRSFSDTFNTATIPSGSTTAELASLSWNPMDLGGFVIFIHNHSTQQTSCSWGILVNCVDSDVQTVGGNHFMSLRVSDGSILFTPAYNSSNFQTNNQTQMVGVAGAFTLLSVRMLGGSSDPALDGFSAFLYVNGINSGLGYNNPTAYPFTRYGSVDVLPGDLVSIKASATFSDKVLVQELAFFASDAKSTMIPNGAAPISGVCYACVPNSLPSSVPMVAPMFTATEFSIPVPVGCDVSNLIIKSPTPAGTGKGFTLTLRKNKADTSLSTSILGFQQTQNQNLGTVTFAKGDEISVKLTPSGTPTLPDVIWFSFNITASGQGAKQLHRAAIKRLGNQVVQTHRASIKDPAHPSWVQTARAQIFPNPAQWFQISAARVATALNQGTGWAGPWSIIDNGLVGPVESGFNPTSDASLFAWYRSDRGLKGASGGLVAQGTSVWKDQSSWSRHLSVDSGKQPSLTTSATPSGKPAVTFPGGSQKFLHMDSGVTGLGQPFTILALVKALAWTNSGYIMDGPDAGHRAAIFQETGSPKISGYGGNSMPDNSDLTLNTWHVLTFCFDSTNSFIQVDNVAAVTGNAGNLPGARLQIGNGVGAVAWTNYSIAALIVVSSHPTSAMLTNHKNWLANYGGITI